jgi:hypothetical protein
MAAAEESITGHLYLSQCPGRILGIIGQNHSVSQVRPLTSGVIFRFASITLEVYSIDSSNIISNFSQTLTLRVTSQTQLAHL